MVLTPDRSIFAEDVVFEDSQGSRLEFDPEQAYTGTLEGNLIPLSYTNGWNVVNPKWVTIV